MSKSKKNDEFATGVTSGPEVVGAIVAEGSTEKPGEAAEGVEAGVAGMDPEAAKARVLQKVSAGNFTLAEDEARAVYEALGGEDTDEQPAFRRFTPENSPTAGSTPATGSGGTPYRADAATDETKKYAKEQEKVVNDKDASEYDKARAKTLAASVKE